MDEDSIIGLWGLTDSSGSCSSSSASDSPPLDDDPPFEVPIPVKTTPIKKIRNVRKSPIHKCAVCGDRPTGYHYDVLSCNGCKTFFRRTVINRRKFVCSRGGNCEFTKDFRCACRACRFSKCVSAGMNPQAIQFPSQPSIEKEEDSDEHYQDLAVVAVTQPVRNEDINHMMALDMIVHREIAVQSYRGNDFPFCIYPDIALEQLYSEPCILGKKKETEDMKSPDQLEMYKENPVRFWMVADLYLAVEFAKTFMDFQSLATQDKSELLYKVGGSIQIITQSYYSAQVQSDSLTFPDGINALYWQLVKLNKTQYELYYRECYCRPVDIIRKLELTLPEFVMFKTIALFSTEADLGADAQRIIKEKREQLTTIFRKYLIKQYGLKQGTERLGICLITIASFIDIAEKRRSYLHCIDLLKKCQISKLAKGIYLKQASISY